MYLAGYNNLDSAGVVDLNEMKTVGTSDKIAVLAQFDLLDNGITNLAVKAACNY